MQKKEINILYSLVAALIASVMLIASGCGNRAESVDMNIEELSAYIMEEVESPSVSSVGGEWSVIGIMNSSIDNETKKSYALRYFDSVRARIKSEKGVLSDSYYTEYARVVMGVASTGNNPADVEGYNLISYLDDYEKVTGQGVNAAAYALVASQMSGVTLQNEERYIDFIIGKMESCDGSDAETADYVSMGILALSYYKDSDDVADIINQKIDELSQAQQEDGSMGNCESTCEAIIALSSAGIDIKTDERFIKDGKSLLNGLFLYKKDRGFAHSEADGNIGEINLMATEKALLALESIQAHEDGDCLYKSKR